MKSGQPLSPERALRATEAPSITDRGASYLSHLECIRCSHREDADAAQNACPKCGAGLWARYDLEAAKEDIDPLTFGSRLPNQWRYAEVLPVRDERYLTTLGEGGTPLLHLSRMGEAVGLKSLLVKDEGQNPTGTVKARGLSAAVSRNLELGVRKFAIATSGNAGGALALYAAAAGATAYVACLESTPPANRAELEASGAEVDLVVGTYTDALARARHKIENEGYFDISTFREPYRLEGKKTIGYEIAEALGWSLPDVIVAPTGGGTSLLGLWKAFDELEQLGLVGSRRPRLVAAQPQGCAPLVTALDQGAEETTAWEGADTLATHIRVPKPNADREILKILRASQGRAVAVSDEWIRASLRELASKEGILAGPEGAAGVAALRKLRDDGAVDAKETVVLLNTGAGIKSPVLGAAVRPEADALPAR